MAQTKLLLLLGRIVMAQISISQQNKHIREKKKKKSRGKRRKETFLGAIHLCKEQRALFADFRTIPTLKAVAKLGHVSIQRKLSSNFQIGEVD